MDPEPPSRSFFSREAAQEALQSWAKTHTFAVVFGRTKKNAKEEIRKQWVKCCKHGLFKPKGLG